MVLIKGTILTESELIAVLKCVRPLEDVWARVLDHAVTPLGLQGTHLSTSLLGLGTLARCDRTSQSPKQMSMPIECWMPSVTPNRLPAL